MTAATVAVVRSGTQSRRLMAAYRFELAKLFAHWRTRVLVGLCGVAPALVVATLSRQSALPSDTVFGRWMGQSGWAGPLVILSFCCSWVLPALTSLIAGDVFAVEDRLGTWRHLLVATRSTRRIFAAKALASVTALVLLTTAIAVSSITGGLLAVGNRALVGLDGHFLSPSHATTAVVLAWVVTVAPMLAFAGVGLLGSVALGRSPVGLLAPALLAVLLDATQLLPLPVAVRVALPSYAFDAWRGLFTQPTHSAALLISVLVSLSWAAVAMTLAYRLFTRRDFSDPSYDGSADRILRLAALPLAALFAVTVGAVTAAFPGRGTGIDRPALETSVATAYSHLYRLQLDELHRPDVTEQQLQTAATCDKGGATVDDHGPGNDWRCTVSWHIPGATATGAAVYQLDVAADGRFVADGDGPQSVNGFFRVRTLTGDAPNPLWQFDGYVDLLTTTSKG